MRQMLFRQALDAAAKRGIAVQSPRTLRALMPGESAASRNGTVRQAVREGLLERLCRGAFLYRYAQTKWILEETALRLRPGHICYLSLERALSEDWGLIEQMALGGITVMTTGRSQTFETPYGRIEFTHTTRPAAQALEGAVRRGDCPLLVASPAHALRDLRRVGRNLDLVQWDALDDAMAAWAEARKAEALPCPA